MTRGDSVLELHATRVAVEYESDEYLCSVQLWDPEQQSGLSLSRFFSPGNRDTTIEVIVADQMNCTVDDVSCTLTGTSLTLQVPEELRQFVDEAITIRAVFDLNNEAYAELFWTLSRIFQGKRGFVAQSDEGSALSGRWRPIIDTGRAPIFGGFDYVVTRTSNSDVTITGDLDDAVQAWLPSIAKGIRGAIGTRDDGLWVHIRDVLVHPIDTTPEGMQSIAARFVWNVIDRAPSLGYLWDTPALLDAAGKGDVDTVRRLLGDGADPATTWPALGDQPLHAAAGGNHVEIMGILLDAGAPVDARMRGGHTALICAANVGHLAAVELLLERGADPTLRTKDGHTAAGRVPGNAPDFAELRRLLATEPADER